MAVEQRGRQPTARHPASSDRPSAIDELWQDEDFHRPDQAEALPSDPWDDMDVPCGRVEQQSGRLNASSHDDAGEKTRAPENDPPSEIDPAAAAQPQDEHGRKEKLLGITGNCAGSDRERQQQANADESLEVSDAEVFETGRAFIEVIRTSGREQPEPRYLGETSRDAHYPAAEAALPYEKDISLPEAPLLDSEWGDEVDWVADEDDAFLDIESSAPSWLDDDEDLSSFEAEEQRNPWLGDAEEEPARTRSARAKAAEIVRLLDLATVHRRDTAIDLLTALFEEFQHGATFGAVRHLAASEGDFDNLQRAVELRQIWAERADWWKCRNYFGYQVIANGDKALPWALAHRLCVLRAEFDPSDIIAEEWIEEWYELYPGEPGYLRFPEFLYHKINNMDAERLCAGLILCGDDPVHPEPIDDPIVRHVFRERLGTSAELFRSSWPFRGNAVAIRPPAMHGGPKGAATSSRSHVSLACSPSETTDPKPQRVEPIGSIDGELPSSGSAPVENSPRTILHFPRAPETVDRMEYSRLDRTMTVVDKEGYTRIYQNVPAEVCERMFHYDDVSGALLELRAGYDVIIKKAFGPR